MSDSEEKYTKQDLEDAFDAGCHWAMDIGDCRVENSPYFEEWFEENKSTNESS